MIPCLFQLNVVFWHRFFSSFIPSFLVFTSSKRTQNYFTTIKHILDVLFIPSIYIYSYLHFVKSVQIRGFFWPVFSRIWTEYRKIRTRRNSVQKKAPEMFCKRRCSWKLCRILQKKNLCQSSFLIKLQALGLQLYYY